MPTLLGMTHSTGRKRTLPKAEARRKLHSHPEPMGPLWVITIAMGVFFSFAALVMMLD